MSGMRLILCSSTSKYAYLPFKFEYFEGKNHPNKFSRENQTKIDVLGDEARTLSLKTFWWYYGTAIESISEEKLIWVFFPGFAPKQSKIPELNQKD